MLENIGGNKEGMAGTHWQFNVQVGEYEQSFYLILSLTVDDVQHPESVDP